MSGPAHHSDGPGLFPAAAANFGGAMKIAPSGPDAPEGMDAARCACKM
jgi:hypothetical protein